METLPAYAKVTEYQLRVVVPDTTQRNAMNLKLQAAAPMRDMWVGQVAFAPMDKATLRKFQGWLNQFDGPVTAWLLPMPLDLQTFSSSFTGTLAATVTEGTNELQLTVSPASGTIAAGTLIAIGSTALDSYQVCEVVADATVTGGAVTVEVSPRIRWAFPAGYGILLGYNELRVRLANDKALADHNFTLASGIITLDVVEAVYA